MRIASTLILLSLLVAWPCHAQEAFDSEVVDKAVQREMERQKIVGAAIGVVQRGKVVYTAAYGKADFERRISADKQTVFNWASNSKPVMAVAALQLVELGRLELDERIGKYLPALPAAMRGITARELLCHQSGIPHYGDVVPSRRRIELVEQLDPAVSVHRFMFAPLAYQPGSKMVYSSYGYVLLSAVVQAAGRERIADQLSNRIGKPLRFTSFQLDLPYKDQKNWAVGYKAGPNGFPRRISDTAHFWKHGAGGYKSDVEDFSRWAVALMNSELLRAETSDQMWTPQSTSSGENTGYGLGVNVSGEGRRLKVSHGGSQDETKTRMVLYPRQRHGLVFMCNTNNANPGEVTTAVYKAMREQ